MDPVIPTTIAAVAALAHQTQPLIKEGAKLIDRLLGEPFKIAGEMISDEMYYWRICRAATVGGKAAILLREQNVDPKQLPPGFLLPFIESASTAESADIENLFASLLASAVSDDMFQHPVFRHAISQINADEARILEYLSTGGDIQVYAIVDNKSWCNELYYNEYPGIALDRSVIYTENLRRLRLADASHLRPSVGPRPHFITEEVAKQGEIFVAEIELSAMGKKLGAIAVKASILRNPPKQDAPVAPPFVVQG